MGHILIDRTRDHLVIACGGLFERTVWLSACSRDFQLRSSSNSVSNMEECNNGIVSGVSKIDRDSIVYTVINPTFYANVITLGCLGSGGESNSRPATKRSTCFC